MKFPSLTDTLKLLKPFSKNTSNVHLHTNNEPEFTLYDKIEEIVSIVDTYGNRQKIIIKFHELTDIQQQLTAVALIEHNLVETLEVILRSNFDMNFLIRGQTPLHFAIRDQKINIMNLLIKYKADIEFKNKFKETALNCAVRTANIDIIKTLLEQGANVNTEASDNSTPLEYAVHQGDIESVNLLEDFGAQFGNSYLVKQR